MSVRIFRRQEGAATSDTGAIVPPTLTQTLRIRPACGERRAAPAGWHFGLMDLDTWCDLDLAYMLISATTQVAEQQRVGR